MQKCVTTRSLNTYTHCVLLNYKLVNSPLRLQVKEKDTLGQRGMNKKTDVYNLYRMLFLFILFFFIILIFITGHTFFFNYF